MMHDDDAQVAQLLIALCGTAGCAVAVAFSIAWRNSSASLMLVGGLVGFLTIVHNLME